MRTRSSIHRRLGAGAGPALARIAGALVLSGCATLPAPATAPDIANPARFASSASLAALEATWPSDRWWQTFNDPQLNALVEEGLSGATDLRVAAARFDRAEALAKQARGRLMPAFNLGAETGITKASSNYLTPKALTPNGSQEYGEVSGSLSWDLDFWGRNRAAFAAARSEVEAAAAEAGRRQARGLGRRRAGLCRPREPLCGTRCG